MERRRKEGMEKRGRNEWDIHITTYQQMKVLLSTKVWNISIGANIQCRCLIFGGKRRQCCETYKKGKGAEGGEGGEGGVHHLVSIQRGEGNVLTGL